MNELVKKDILAVLAGVVDILDVEEDRDFGDLKELSNHTIHNASIFQDEDSISIAILIYSLSKLIERREGKLNYSSVLNLLKNAQENLEEDNVELYRKTIRKLFDFISNIDTKLKLYIEEVIKQAQIKKGSKLYEHGISMARAAQILGVSQWELMSYVGKTTLTDLGGGVNINQRLSYARSIFK